MFPTDTLDLTVEENIGDGSKIMQLTAMDADEVVYVFRVCSPRDSEFQVHGSSSVP